MLWLYGLSGAFCFASIPLGVSLFGEIDRTRKAAAIYTYVVMLATGAILGQVFGSGVADMISAGVLVQNVHFAVRMNAGGAATFLGLGGNIWWPTMVRRIDKALNGAEARRQ